MDKFNPNMFAILGRRQAVMLTDLLNLLQEKCFGAGGKGDVVGVPQQSWGGGVFISDSNQNDTYANKAFRAKITDVNYDLDPSGLYSWTEQTPQVDGTTQGVGHGHKAVWANLDAPRSGTCGSNVVIPSNPAYEANNNPIAIGTIVNMRRAYVDTIYEWVYVCDSEDVGGATPGPASVVETTTVTNAPVTVFTIELDNVVPANVLPGFGPKFVFSGTNTLATVEMGFIQTVWTTATSGNQSSQMQLGVVNVAAEVVGISITQSLGIATVSALGIFVNVVTSAVNNAVVYVEKKSANVTVPANTLPGFGPGIKLQASTTSTPDVDQSYIASTWTTATAGAQVGKLEFGLYYTSTQVPVLTLTTSTTTPTATITGNLMVKDHTAISTIVSVSESSTFSVTINSGTVIIKDHTATNIIVNITETAVTVNQSTTISISTAVTNTTVTTFTITANSTSTTDVGFGIKILYELSTTTTPNTPAAFETISWTTPTDGSQVSLFSLWTYNTTVPVLNIEVTSTTSTDPVTKIYGQLVIPATATVSTTIFNVTDSSNVSLFAVTIDGAGVPLINITNTSINPGTTSDPTVPPSGYVNIATLSVTGIPTFVPPATVSSPLLYNTVDSQLWVYNPLSTTWEPVTGGSASIEIDVTPVTSGIPGDILVVNTDLTIGQVSKFPRTPLGTAQATASTVTKSVTVNAGDVLIVDMATIADYGGISGVTFNGLPMTLGVQNTLGGLAFTSSIWWLLVETTATANIVATAASGTPQLTLLAEAVSNLPTPQFLNIGGLTAGGNSAPVVGVTTGAASTYIHLSFLLGQLSGPAAQGTFQTPVQNGGQTTTDTEGSYEYAFESGFYSTSDGAGATSQYLAGTTPTQWISSGIGFIVGPANSINTPNTVVAGSTSGTAEFTQPLTGPSLKTVVIYCTALLGTASYTFPVPFINTPVVLTTTGVSTAVVTSLSTTAVTLTGATTTGFLILEGY